MASLSGGSLLGVIGSEDVTLSQAGTFNSANAGTAIGVTAANGLIGAGASNYSLTQPTGLAADLLAKPVTITGLVASNKVYDGTAAATVGNWGAVATGVGSFSASRSHARWCIGRS